MRHNCCFSSLKLCIPLLLFVFAALLPSEVQSSKPDGLVETSSVSTPVSVEVEVPALESSVDNAADGAGDENEVPLSNHTPWLPIALVIIALVGAAAFASGLIKFKR